MLVNWLFSTFFSLTKKSAFLWKYFLKFRLEPIFVFNLKYKIPHFFSLCQPDDDMSRHSHLLPLGLPCDFQRMRYARMYTNKVAKSKVTDFMTYCCILDSNYLKFYTLTYQNLTLPRSVWIGERVERPWWKKTITY